MAPATEWADDKYGQFEWTRAQKIPDLTDDEGDVPVFSVEEDGEESVSPNDIKQGELGDCYFLSSLSVIAENPERIKKMFLVTEPNDQCVYAIQMYKNGEKVTVVLDDYIVTKQGRPAFSKSNGPEIWVLLLEKAWAKIHGSFHRIVSGQSHLTMRDLSGAPGYEYIIAEHDDIFDIIKNADEMNYCMAIGCGKKDSDKEALKKLGLVTEHSYGIIAAAVVTGSDGVEVNICKLRNPWGNFEW